MTQRVPQKELMASSESTRVRQRQRGSGTGWKAEVLVAAAAVVSTACEATALAALQRLRESWALCEPQIETAVTPESTHYRGRREN